MFRSGWWPGPRRPAVPACGDGRWSGGGFGHLGEGLGEHDHGDVFGAFGGVGGVRVGVELSAGGLHTLKRALGAVGLAHHAGGLGAAFGGAGVVLGREEALGPVKAVVPLLAGGDDLGGEDRLGGVIGAECGDLGDDRVVAVLPIDGDSGGGGRVRRRLWSRWW